jgi:hypothetical protein
MRGAKEEKEEEDVRGWVEGRLEEGGLVRYNPDGLGKGPIGVCTDSVTQVESNSAELRTKLPLM